jgi:thiol-disulfide isomerase/thioredoxin
LSPINILIGSNGVGKSNFISFFKLVNNIYEQRLELFSLKSGIDNLLHYGRKNTSSIIGELNFGSNAYSFILSPTDDGTLFIEREDSKLPGVTKYKETIFAALPKDLDAGFVAKYKGDVEKGMKGMIDYLSAGFELKKLNGTASPTFKYENHKGGVTSLEDLKGKFVYVDVWATWCGPCRQEIPFLQKTEAAYHGKNIEFVSISIDEQKNHDKWSKFVTEKNLGGIQLLADKDWKSDFVQGYKIEGIPRFILISPEGKIVNADAPRPSSPELVTLLDSLVK